MLLKRSEISLLIWGAFMTLLDFIEIPDKTKNWVASCVCPTSQHVICRNHGALWLYGPVWCCTGQDLKLMTLYSEVPNLHRVRIRTSLMTSVSAQASKNRSNRFQQTCRACQSTTPSREESMFVFNLFNSRQLHISIISVQSSLFVFGSALQPSLAEKRPSSLKWPNFNISHHVHESMTTQMHRSEVARQYTS